MTVPFVRRKRRFDNDSLVSTGRGSGGPAPGPVGVVGTEPPPAGARSLEKTCSSAIRTARSIRPTPPALPAWQSDADDGSLSDSAVKREEPVHWLLVTTSRRCVATVSDTSKLRRFRSGVVGRGAAPGDASAGLV